jgi:hypothetical protein
MAAVAPGWRRDGLWISLAVHDPEIFQVEVYDCPFIIGMASVISSAFVSSAEIAPIASLDTL